jgi:hypothetical protein
MNFIYALLLAAFAAAAYIGEHGHRDVAMWLAGGIALISLSLSIWQRLKSRR